MLGIIIDNY